MEKGSGMKMLLVFDAGGIGSAGVASTGTERYSQNLMAFV